jgi:hypothetical protein
MPMPAKEVEDQINVLIMSMSQLEFTKNIRTESPETVTYIINPLNVTQDISNDPLYDSTDLELASIIHKPILLDHLTRPIGNRR